MIRRKFHSDRIFFTRAVTLWNILPRGCFLDHLKLNLIMSTVIYSTNAYNTLLTSSLYALTTTLLNDRLAWGALGFCSEQQLKKMRDFFPLILSYFLLLFLVVVRFCTVLLSSDCNRILVCFEMSKMIFYVLIDIRMLSHNNSRFTTAV